MGRKGQRVYLLLSVVAVAVFWYGPGSLRAQTPGLQGRVVNGTTNQPVANAEVQYVLLQQGMAPVAQAKTDAEGRFRFQDVAAPSNAPALLQVEYQGATYSTPLLPGQSPKEGLDIQVFEASQQPDLVSVVEQAIYLHPTADTLMVIEQVMVENRSNPPKTYVNPQGTYFFTLPGAPREGVQASIQGAMGMPLPQTPVPQKKANSFALTYPVRPGGTEIRLEYSLDYRPPFEFAKPLDVLAKQTHIVTPGKDVQVSGESLVALGADPSTGFEGYRVTPVGNVVRLQVSGQAPAISAGSTVESAEEAGGLMPIPDPISRRRWLVLSLLSLVMLAGFVYLYTR